VVLPAGQHVDRYLGIRTWPHQFLPGLDEDDAKSEPLHIEQRSGMGELPAKFAWNRVHEHFS
jgi:hypothetical protein